MPNHQLLENACSERGHDLRDRVKLVSPQHEAFPDPPLQVLVVEDDQAIRDLVTVALLDEGYQVLSASNGADALVRVQQYSPDVILLDVQMPVMDGPTFAERYRSLPGPHAPIVVFTAAGGAQRWAERIRAMAYVDKPVDLWVLSDLVRRCARARAA